MSLINPHLHQHETKKMLDHLFFTENFGVVSKVDKTLEIGDMPFVLKVLSITSIYVIKDGENVHT